MTAPGVDAKTPEFTPAVRRAAADLGVLRARIATQHATGAPGVQTCGLASDLCDRIVADVWGAILADLPGHDAAAVASHAALVAHGGYGRREMAPFSDLDLMLLHDGRSPDLVAAAATRLLQNLFDAGLQVGQSVRSVPEAVGLALGDATILSSMLDCRALAGNVGLVRRLEGRLRSAVRRAPRRHATRLVAARREEADRFGQTVALLQPNVKRSPGGLRDVQLVRWLGLVLHNASSLDEIALAGGLSRGDADAVRDAAEFLMRVRNDLHLAAGKAADDITREEQLRIATARGIESRDGLLGVERFMQEYFGHTRRIARAVEGIAAVLDRPHPLRGLAAGALGHRVDGIYRVGPRAVAAERGRGREVASNVAAILRLLELSLLYELPIDRATWQAVRTAAPALPRSADPTVVPRFLALFERPAGLADVLRRLHDAGILEIVIPEFAHARDLLQFNNYHKYTVDEHCILAVERAAGFATDDGWLGRTWQALKRKRPLLLALLIHDLGKGLPGDHSEVGAGIARTVATRLGLPADEAEIVEFLVLRHLSMAHLAFRRDVEDDSLVVRFACEVGSPEVLRMLALLTAADVAAVGPGTWTKWKSDLLGELCYRVLGHLDGAGPSVAAERTRRALDPLLADRDADDPVLRLARELPPSYLRHTAPPRIVEELGRLARLPADGVFASARWQPDTSTVAITVGTREGVAPGIFHRITGAVSSQRLEILSADIHTLDDGLVIDHFQVLDPDFAGEPPAERLADIAAAIRQAIRAEEPPRFSRCWNPFAPLPAATDRVPTRVLFDNESSEHATIVEVFTHDSVGLLYSVAKALFDAGLSVTSAKIGTHLDQVVDAFHVTDARGGKVTDPTRLVSIRRDLEAAAAPLRAPA